MPYRRGYPQAADPLAYQSVVDPNVMQAYSNIMQQKEAKAMEAWQGLATAQNTMSQIPVIPGARDVYNQKLDTMQDEIHSIIQDRYHGDISLAAPEIARKIASHQGEFAQGARDYEQWNQTVQTARELYMKGELGRRYNPKTKSFEDLDINSLINYSPYDEFGNYIGVQPLAQSIYARGDHVKYLSNIANSLNNTSSGLGLIANEALNALGYAHLRTEKGISPEGVEVLFRNPEFVERTVNDFLNNSPQARLEFADSSVEDVAEYVKQTLQGLVSVQYSDQPLAMRDTSGTTPTRTGNAFVAGGVHLKNQTTKEYRELNDKFRKIYDGMGIESGELLTEESGGSWFWENLRNDLQAELPDLSPEHTMLIEQTLFESFPELQKIGFLDNYYQNLKEATNRVFGGIESGLNSITTGVLKTLGASDKQIEEFNAHDASREIKTQIIKQMLGPLGTAYEINALKGEKRRLEGLTELTRFRREYSEPLKILQNEHNLSEREAIQLLHHEHERVGAVGFTDYTSMSDQIDQKMFDFVRDLRLDLRSDVQVRDAHGQRSNLPRGQNVQEFLNRVYSTGPDKINYHGVAVIPATGEIVIKTTDNKGIINDIVLSPTAVSPRSKGVLMGIKELYEQVFSPAKMTGQAEIGGHHFAFMKEYNEDEQQFITRYFILVPQLNEENKIVGINPEELIDGENFLNEFVLRAMTVGEGKTVNIKDMLLDPYN